MGGESCDDGDGLRRVDHPQKPDRVIRVEVGGGAVMSVPLGDWMWQMNHVRPEPSRGTKCDDRMLAVGVCESYRYLIEHCTKEEAWSRIKLLRAALKAQETT